MSKLLNVNQFTYLQRNRGFTLLEVLITVVILSIGLLGVAAMQLQGLQYNHDAYLRSQVNMLATDIAERMRLNRANAASYISNYTLVSGSPPSCTVGSGANAANDLACWHLDALAVLPDGGSANITQNAPPDTDVYTVTLSWIDRDVNTTRPPLTYSFVP